MGELWWPKTVFICQKLAVGGGGGTITPRASHCVLTFGELSSNINSVSEPTPLQLKHFFG